MVMKILTIIFFFEIKESKITRGHNFTLVKKQSDWMLDSFHFPRGPPLYGITESAMINHNISSKLLQGKGRKTEIDV